MRCEAAWPLRVCFVKLGPRSPANVVHGRGLSHASPGTCLSFLAQPG